MAKMRDDHKVKFVREETIEETALSWLREAGMLNRPYFNIVTFVKTCLRAKLRKGSFKIAFFDAKPDEKPAYVSFNPLTLNIDRDTWRDADLGEPFARFIVAHEIGHIIFHDAYAQAFSYDPANRVKFVEKEETAEWQADTFAYYVLMPTHVVSVHDYLDALIGICGVTREHAVERLSMMEARRPR